MRRRSLVGLLGVLLAVGACRDVRTPAGPAASRQKWGWDQPLATGGPPPSPALACSPSTVTLGSTVTCTLSNVPPSASPTWSFRNTDVSVDGPGNTASWSGPLATSGEVRVDFEIDGSSDFRTFSVVVTRRTWSWASSIGGSAGSPGDIDSCFGVSDAGLTASVNCSGYAAESQLLTPRPSQLQNGTGYSSTSVSSNGPNGGVWYVTQATAGMDLRTQVSKEFRADGAAYAMLGHATVVVGCANAFPAQPTLGRNTHTVNITCTGNYTSQFNGYVSCLWAHEGAHLSGALASAATSTNDLHAVWEPRVGDSDTDLRDEIQLDAQYLEGRINTDAYNAAHNLPQQSFSFWRFEVASGWQATTQTPKCSS